MPALHLHVYQHVGPRYTVALFATPPTLDVYAERCYRVDLIDRAAHKVVMSTTWDDFTDASETYHSAIDAAREVR